MYRPSGETTWLTLGAIVVAHELLCRDGQFLTEACDRARRRHPVLVWATILTTAGHLLDVLPHEIDPWRRLGRPLAAAVKARLA
ncbi:hypothetical protein [Nocardia sp. NPDC046763]|uniref:DUF7427 family protein n=1 Tax=Nocardia sp. NPDC046763 TaxID=3155256 RepID=UPI0033FDCF68